MFQPCATRHIGHFVESINHALLKLRYSSFYPPFTDLYIPSFSIDEFEWSKSYMQLVLRLFPDNLKPAVHLGGSIPTYSAVCPLDLMKATAWRHANVQSRQSAPSRLSLLLVDRKKTRGFTLHEAWVGILSSRFKVG